MGVRGLQTFLENHSPQACYSVDISKLAKEYKIRTGKEPVMVIDAQSCYHMWYEGMDWLVGYEIYEFIIRLRAFVDSFKKLGIRLVFFFGGLNPEKKRKTWLERRRKTLQEIHQAIDFLTTYGHVPVDFQSILPNPGLTTAYILKYVLDCEVYMTVKECDEEVIDYADKHKCFAIFGQDTDFVISQVDALVLSSKKFKIETMTTLLYDRTQLALGLGLRVDELPLLAILAGNDLVRFDTIKEFHRKIGGGGYYRGVPYQVLMPAIGRYILKFRNESLEMKFRRMAEDLFSDLSQVQLLKTSYNSYFVEKTTVGAPSTDKWSKILLTALTHYRNTRLPSLLYSVLTEQLFEGGTSFEDLRKHHDGNALVRDQCSSSVLRPMRSRLYGILLFEKDGSNTVREWCNNNVNSYSQPDVVQSIKPEVHHPGLMVLWSDDKKDCINDMRWKLFLTSIHPTINTDECWQSFDEELLFTTLSVYYLFKREYLNELEMDAVLITIATCPLYDQKKLFSLKYNKLDFRAANISITLNRTFGLVLTLLAACGYPIELSSTNAYLKFEGKLFQRKYADVMKEKGSHGALCEDNAKSLEVFHRMKNKILEIKDGKLNEDFINKMSKVQV